MYVRWQHRTTRQRLVDLAGGAQEPAAHDLALEAAARAVARSLSRHPRRTNPRSGGSSEPRISWVAVIVESRRVDGRPRQHLIRYIRSIDCADVHRLAARRGFWDRADVVLAEFDQEQRERFEQALETKVRRPTAEEVAAASPAALRARFDAIRAARATLRSIGAQAPIKAPTASAPLPETETGDDNRQVSGQPEAATGTS